MIRLHPEGRCTAMDNQRLYDIRFLRAKLELLCAEVPDEPTKANARLLLGTPLEGWLRGDTPLPPRRALVQHERTMEQFLMPGLSMEVRQRMERQLLEQFGFSSLGKPVSTRVERILKKGAIQSEEDARIVNGLLGDLDNELVLGAEKFRRLAELMGEYESR